MNLNFSAWWTCIAQIKRSVIWFLITFALGLFSMGGLGGAICFLVSPVLSPIYGDFDSWHGDWVWPAMIGSGMAWAFGFLGAGFLNLRLERKGLAPVLRRTIYVAVLWCWALGVWWIILWNQAL